MAQQITNMTRNELKQLWLSIPTDPNKKETNTILVEVNYGHVTITSDGPNGFSESKSSQGANALKYALDRMSEGFDGLRDLSKYQLIIK